jgi:hypothetical protein
MGIRTSVQKLIAWYEKYERWVSSLSLIGGFIFDAFVLKRIDLFWENFWVVVHLLMAAVGIILLNLLENVFSKGKISELTRARIHFWLIIFVQIAFGGLLSVFLVFYFRSATLATSWPFLLLLALAFAFNELLKQHYTRLVFQISIFFLSVYAFAIFIVPVFVHRIGADIFILSGFASVFVLAIFLLSLWYMTRERFLKSRTILLWSIGAILVIMNALYFSNLIPPIPLSLKELGVYHSVTRTKDGFALEYEPQSILNYVRSRDTVHLKPGMPLYVFSSVFSPTEFRTNVIHHWQKYDEKKKEWVSQSRISLQTFGGNDYGFRTYSMSRAVTPGLWRVDVETDRGQDLGRVTFNVEQTDTVPPLRTHVN